MITVPTLLLDESKCRNNIKKMAKKAIDNNIIFRPHFKTHQSTEIGKWFREEGIEKITVSSLRMAEYFASDGWKDILVAFPVNILEIETINQLASEIRLSLLVESIETVGFLSKNLKSPVEVYIKADVGSHRTGVAYNDFDTMSLILEAISDSDLISFRGFLTHAGNSYRARSLEEISKVHFESISRMAELKYHFMNNFPGLIISVGDTPTCSLMDDFSMVDEIRPGNFVFYDLTQIVIGSCPTGQVAVAMACPVVAVHPERNELVIYGGSVHFSNDSVRDRDGNVIHGMAVRNEGEGWGEIINGVYLARLSQEHGIIRLPENLVRQFNPGVIIKIIPAHSCITASNMKEYQTLTGKKVTMMP